MIRRATPQHRLDERRFRFRARFERPPGGGSWDMEKTLLRWLDERLGRGNYAFQEDVWDGHGLQCYALHFDDHTIIPELLARYDAIRTEIRRTPTFVAQLSRDQAHSVRDGLRAVQAVLVDALNAQGPRVAWVLGRCSFLPREPETLGDRLSIARINTLSEVIGLLGVSDSEDDVRSVVLKDDQRGAVEVGFALYRDKKPPDAEVYAAALRAFLGMLKEH